MTERRGPVLIDLDEESATPSPAEAAPVPEPEDAPPQGAAMQGAAAIAGRRASRLARWFWASLGALISFMISVAAWDFVTGLLDRSPLLGWAALALVGLVCGLLGLIALKELVAFRRLKRLDVIQREAARAHAGADLSLAGSAADRLTALYAGRDDTRWGRDRLAERRGDIFDADGLLGLCETEVLAPLDARALREVEGAARQVATVTAVVPLAFADVFAALTANLRMIRRIAEIYGGRSGTLESWRLARSVFAHLVATGAVAVGDDLVGTVAGGGLLSRVSRRFGEGVVNGALTARVGVAAIEVCRPLPFRAVRRPSVSSLVSRSLTGLFGSRD